uniref:Cytochrome b561 domain-containing protein n=1 Tax=Parastrongyloides trichosuri TaxID=131310 RepID=A0A0N4ZS77_PARTI
MVRNNIYGNTVSRAHPYWDYFEENDDYCIGLDSKKNINYESLKAKQASLRFFDFFSTLNQFFGILMVILIGYFYGNIDGSYEWKDINSNISDNTYYRSYLNLHGLAVIVGLVFLQGEGILINRHFRHEPKSIFKLYQIVFNLIALACGAFALAASIIYSNKVESNHFYSFQSWLLLGVLAIYLAVSSTYLFVFTFPRLQKNIRQALKPYINVMCLVTFILSSLYSILSNALYINKYVNNNEIKICTNNKDDCIDQFRYIMNFGLVATVLYSIVVVIQASKPSWSRKLKDI